jgi:serine/threonine-protein kinase 24/25/MST4
MTVKPDLPTSKRSIKEEGTVRRVGVPARNTAAAATAEIEREPSDEYDEEYERDYAYGHEGGASGDDDLADSTMLDSVVLPAIASVRDPFTEAMPRLTPPQLFPRVSTQEARIALSSLQKAFTEAERIIPGVTLELVNEIVDSVEHVEDER